VEVRVFSTAPFDASTGWSLSWFIPGDTHGEARKQRQRVVDVALAQGSADVQRR
jgi:hypothetical protein